MTFRAVVLADTHVRAGGRRPLPDAVLRLAEGADLIVHAGDLVEACVLASLGELAPIVAVLGNNDRGLEDQLPVTATVSADGLTIGLVHDSGPEHGRGLRLHRLFPHADVVVFGHSHIPVATAGVEGQFLFNPGSPTQRRRQPHCTAGELEVADGRLMAARIVVVDK